MNVGYMKTSGQKAKLTFPPLDIHHVLRRSYLLCHEALYNPKAGTGGGMA
jgi:hypothetical protein